MNARSVLLFVALLLVTGGSVAADRPSTASRGVHVLSPPLHIAGLDRDRSIRVYLPPSYGRGHRRYPVLYMHDGQNLFDNATSFIGEWGVDEAMDALAKSDGIEVIVVGIDNDPHKRIDELSPWVNAKYGGGEGRQYMEFVVGTVKPFIDRSYRTRPGRADTGIMGSSLGALESHYAAYQYPKVFGRIGVFSPSYWFAPEIYDFTAQRRLPPDTRMYMVVGDKEGDQPQQVVDDMRRMDTLVRGQGNKRMAMLTAVRAGAEHNETFWKNEFPRAIQFLFGPR